MAATKVPDCAGPESPAKGGARRLTLGDRSVLIGHPAMAQLFDLARRLATSDLPVLIIGETGSGKDSAAYAIHHYSSRHTRPFLALNCAALPDSLVESELFGHDRGAFSGAVIARPGLLESASGGTLFLDEVGELAPAAQAKLLRALETQRVTRVGERKERAIDVRLVAATNCSLDEQIAAGRFRADLFFRLAAARLVVPPLRARRCEIPILFRAFLTAAAARADRTAPSPSRTVMNALVRHSWPGNVRELKNVAEYLAATVTRDLIELGDLPFEPQHDNDAATPEARFPARRLADELAELERRRMAEALAATGGVKSRAAELLGMPIRTFSWKLRKRERRVNTRLTKAACAGPSAAAGSST